jgi:hypothetical protein
MDFTTLTQLISDNTQIGKHDISTIMSQAFSILIANSNTQTLTIPSCDSSPAFHLTITKI